MMPEAYTQADHLIAVDTPLGPDKLLLRSFSGTEGISQLFHFQLDLLSEDPDIDFDKIIGQKVTVSVKLADLSKERYFSGHISRFAQLPGERRLARYQAEMVPWLWFLTRTTDCRIFQNRRVPDIIQQVFRDFGWSDFEDQLQGSYEPKEYCVQYRETACNFVMRLMEQEGIFFFFRHERGKHVLVMADSPLAHKPCPDAASVRYEHVFGPGYRREEDVILRWRYQQELRPGKYAVKDYNFKEPGTILHNELVSSINQGGNRKYEIFEYPGGYETLDQGDALARLRIEEQEAPHEAARGDSNCRAFSPGFRFGLTGHERQDQNTQYVLTEVTHCAESGSFHTEKAGEGASYSNSFACIPYAVRFRPPRVTPKPRVQGPQTAVVCGRETEEIWTDEYGRVKVQFHWDRRGEWDEDSSCWIRVSQPWAGRNWGAIAIPRIGQEVVVDFLEGDPDRPIITGRVYNARQMPPYSLPANQTQSGIKSRSSKEGGSANFNEIRFEDKKGAEVLTIHAERTMRESVEASQYITVGGDRHITTGGESGGTRTGDTKEKVFRNRHLHVLGNQRVMIEGETGEEYVGDSIEYHDGDHALGVGVKLLVDAQEVVIQGSSKITLLAGGSYIVLDAGGVKVVGPMVSLNPLGAVPVTPEQCPWPEAPEDP
jgi:type VI secretion system secreted protein VgrG